MKKVVFVSCTDFLGGAETFLLSIHRLLSTSYDLYFVVSSPQLYESLNTNNKIFNKSSGFLSTIRVVNEYVFRKNIDFVILNGNRAIYLAPFLKYNRRVFAYKHTGSRSVNGFVKRLLYYMIVNYSYRYCDHIICVSRAIAEEVNFFKGKLSVVYNGVDVSLFKERDYDETRASVVISFVARLVKEKGIWEALFTLEQLRSEYNIEFNIVGTGDQLEKIKKYIKDHKIEGFYVKGYQSNVISILNSSDIFLLPSYYESFGLSICEAMSIGLPIVSTQVGGIPEIVRNEIEGFLVDVENESSLLDALRELIVDSRLRITMGKRSRQRVVEKFSLEKCVESLKIVLKRFH